MQTHRSSLGSLNRAVHSLKRHVYSMRITLADWMCAIRASRMFSHESRLSRMILLESLAILSAMLNHKSSRLRCSLHTEVWTKMKVTLLYTVCVAEWLTRSDSPEVTHEAIPGVRRRRFAPTNNVDSTCGCSIKRKERLKCASRELMAKLPEKTSEFLTKNKFENKLNNDLGKSVIHSHFVLAASCAGMSFFDL